MYKESSDLGLQIKEEDNNKFFTRLLSKETSMAQPSFRVAVPVAVPFIWESQPGTPKHSLSFSHDSTLLPPLTPPPSYFLDSSVKKDSKKASSRSHLIHILFSRFSPKKTNTTTTTSNLSALFQSSSYSSSSLSSSSSLPSTRIRERRRFSSCGSSFDSRIYEYDQDASILESPTRGTKGCYSWW
ncbi:hypothetical protein M5689_009534 [Euphorbia peplus]|nr:hypothetical protein M5689_009534 [Euphorbia peplus]